MNDDRLADIWNAQDFFIDQVTQVRCYNPHFPTTDKAVYFLFGTIDITKFDPI